jgi:SAM-dependent methyltransferase
MPGIDNSAGKMDLRIDLGCGSVKKEGTLGIDISPGPSVDYVVDLSTQPLPFPSRSVSYVHSSHFFEHLTNPINIFKEVSRVAIDGAQLEFWTPYAWSNSAIVLGHVIYLAEDFYLHFQWYSDFWSPILGAHWVIKEFRYIVDEKTIYYLYKNGIDLDLAIKHFKNVASEFCVFITVFHGDHKPYYPPIKRTFATSRFGTAFELLESPLLDDAIPPNEIMKAIDASRKK